MEINKINKSKPAPKTEDGNSLEKLHAEIQNCVKEMYAK